MRTFYKLFAALTAAVVAVCGGSALHASAVVTVDDGVFQYAYSGDAWQLYKYIGTASEVVLPQSFGGLPVTSVAEQCFLQSDVSAVSVPEGYTEIGGYAFYGCENLTEVSLPSTLETLGAGAFYGSGLTDIDLSQTQLSAVNSYTFTDCAALSEVILPGTLQTVRDSVFLNSGLQEIVLPEGVTSLGESCFAGSALRAAELPESLETIGASAFRNATALTELYLPESVCYIGGYALFPMSVQGSVRVTCFENTYANQYCYENFVNNTVTYQKLFGDADLDGAVSINDVTAIQRFCSELDAPSRPARILSDVQRDDSINIGDATLIQRYLAEFEDAVLG